MKWQTESKELSNKLKAYSTSTGTDSVTVLLLIKVGSRNENEATNGLSHFVEHMVFKGTKKWPTAMEMNKVIESVGGVFNAFTGKEYTGFWVKLSKKHLKLGLEFLHQAVFSSLIPADELEKERGVILEEIKMYEDNPMANVARQFVSQIYSSTPLGKPVIGTAENVKRFTREEFVDHLNKWYQPENMVLSMAGGVDKDSLKVASDVFGKTKIKVDIPKREKVVVKKVSNLQIIKKDIQQAHFVLGYRGLERGHQDRYVMAVLNTILGGNTSSRLWNEIREKRGLVYYVRSGVDDYLDVGHVAVQAGCSVDRLKEAVEITKTESLKMADKLVKEDELKLAKDYLTGRLTLSLENSQTVADLVAEDTLFEGKTRNPEEIAKEIGKVSSKDVLRLAKSIFKRGEEVVTVLGKVSKNDVY